MIIRISGQFIFYSCISAASSDVIKCAKNIGVNMSKKILNVFTRGITECFCQKMAWISEKHYERLYFRRTAPTRNITKAI